MKLERTDLALLDGDNPPTKNTLCLGVPPPDSGWVLHLLLPAAVSNRRVSPAALGREPLPPRVRQETQRSDTPHLINHG